MDWTDIRAEATRDCRRGLSVPPEAMAVAALVMMPFALALALLVNSMGWWPAWTMLLLWLVLLVPAVFWNAGWRARTAMADGTAAPRDEG